MLKGVDRVNSYFEDNVEKNIVWYDPLIITIKEMEKVLKNAGAYLKTDN